MDVRLVRQDDPAALTAALRELARDAPLRERLAAHWSARVARDFTDRRLAERLAEVLDRATA
jgi:glycosyltransferase involved in cell wall biosynthesis